MASCDLKRVKGFIVSFSTQISGIEGVRVWGVGYLLEWGRGGINEDLEVVGLPVVDFGEADLYIERIKWQRCKTFLKVH